MLRRARRAVLGGTFDHFHRGHEELLSAGLSASEHLGVGVTTGGYLKGHPKPRANRIEPFPRRKGAVVQYLTNHASPDRFTVASLSDTWGRSVDPDVDLLVASADTRAGVRSVNEERKRRGLAPLRVRWVRFVLGDDLLPISSRRIRAGLIDREGKRRVPLDMLVVSDRPQDLQRVARVWKRTLGLVPLRVTHRRPGPRTLVPATDASLRRRAVNLARETAMDHELVIVILRGDRGSLGVSVRDATGGWPAPRATGPRPESLERSVLGVLEARRRGRGQKAHHVRT